MVVFSVAAIALTTAVTAAAFNDSSVVPGNDGGFYPLAGRDDVRRNVCPFGMAPAPNGTKVLMLGTVGRFMCKPRWCTVRRLIAMSLRH